jgi:glucosamine-6-phosphate deaminase
MKITRLRTVDQLAQAVADRLEGLLAVNPRAVIGWPSGRTTVPVLARLASAGHASFRGATIVMMDDCALADPAGGFRNCDPSAHYSCRTWVDAELLPALRSGDDVPQVLIPDAAAPADYEDRIAALGGINLFLAGVGSSDAHIAFNPPGTPADSRTRVIALAASTRQDNLGTFPGFAGLGEVPVHGVTVGLATITDAAAVVGIAHGPGKAEAVQRVLDAGAFTPHVPASALYLNPKTEFMIAAINGEELS